MATGFYGHLFNVISVVSLAWLEFTVYEWGYGFACELSLYSFPVYYWGMKEN